MNRVNEAETRAGLIDPALKDAGWGVVEGSRVRREALTLGRLQGTGVRAKPDIADYVLAYRNQKLAVFAFTRITSQARAPKRRGERTPLSPAVGRLRISDCRLRIQQAAHRRERGDNGGFRAEWQIANSE